MKLKPFQIITLLHPKDVYKDSEQEEDTVVLSDMELVMATDDRQAGVLAARKIPENQIKNLSRIEIIVRPF